MDITFDDRKLEKIMNNQKSLQKTYGQIGAKIIRKRLDDMKAALNLSYVKFLPGKYHELKEDRKGQLAVHVEEPKRLVFRPNHNPLPINEDGGLIWELVTSISIIEIIDYHGK